MVEVKSKKHFDPVLMDLNKSVLIKNNYSFSQREDGVLRYKGRLCVSDVDYLWDRFMDKAHSIHPGATKMYHNLHEIY